MSTVKLAVTEGTTTDAEAAEASVDDVVAAAGLEASSKRRDASPRRRNRREDTANAASRALTSTETPLDHSPPPEDASTRSARISTTGLVDEPSRASLAVSSTSSLTRPTRASTVHRVGARVAASTFADADAVASNKTRTARAPALDGFQGRVIVHSPVDAEIFTILSETCSPSPRRAETSAETGTSSANVTVFLARCFSGVAANCPPFSPTSRDSSSSSASAARSATTRSHAGTFAATPPPPSATSTRADDGIDDATDEGSTSARSATDVLDPVADDPIHARGTPASANLSLSVTPAAMRSASPADVPLTSNACADSNDVSTPSAVNPSRAGPVRALTRSAARVTSAAVSSPATPNPPTRASDDCARNETLPSANSKDADQGR